MHSSDINFKVHEEIEVGEIIAKFDISGRDRSWRDYRQIRYFWPNSAKHLVSNMARQTRVRQSCLAIGSPTPLSGPKIIDEVGRVTS